MADEKTDPNGNSLAFFAGGGEMGERTRAFDWSGTPLGPAASWPENLKNAVRIMLNSRFPMFIWWGPERTHLYNDGYAPILGQRHPDALGRAAADVWSEIWHTVGAQAETVFGQGLATWNEETPLVMQRNGYPEEAYFTYSYSPIPDDRGVGGLFCACTEDTQRVLSRRRFKTLRDVATRTSEAAKSAELACHSAAEILRDNPHDLPFTLIYLIEPDGKSARLVEATGLPHGFPAAVKSVELVPAGETVESYWPLRSVLDSGRTQMVEKISDRFGPFPSGVWPDPPDKALVLPLSKSGQDLLTGFLVTGISPYRPLDEDYRGFLHLLAGHIATAVTNARAYEEERLRAESLAELDRAKTTFFSNVSHEFRTPLTLILGPLDDAISETSQRRQLDRLDLVQRNALRLQKLVNTLLDFSRIEAGRAEVKYRPIDLSKLTEELVSNFRSACEKAELELQVDCRTLPAPVYVDSEMWEKIVLNLVSNAFKYTLRGSIQVSVRAAGEYAELIVADTGAGIPSEELPKLFDRFHRVEGVTGRSQEGSGIGLALVRELVRLHGGQIIVSSEVGRGTTFRLMIPFGKGHLPAKHVDVASSMSASSLSAAHYVSEAMRWLPDSQESRQTPLTPITESERRTANQRDAETDRSRIVLVDDNSDMRQYLVKLLSDSFQVRTATDGKEALEIIRRWSPDLVLTDVMMPRLDGFGLLRELRADPKTKELPIIMLSARAGEESRIEGMEAGADDYLVKPFGARELLACVSAHLKIARLRREVAESLRQQEAELHDAQRVAHVGSWRWDAASDVTTGSSELFRIYGLDPSQPFPDFKAQDGLLYPHDEWERINSAVQRTIQTGIGYQLDVQAFRNGEPIWITTRSEVVQGAHGKIMGLRGTVQDITERKKFESALQQSEERLLLITDSLPTLIAYVDSDGIYRFNNRAYEEWFQRSRNEVTGRRMRDILGEMAWSVIGPKVQAAFGGQSVSYEAEVDYEGAGKRWIEGTYVPHFDNGRVVGLFILVNDITTRKLAEQASRLSEERFRVLFDTMTEGFAIDEILFDETGKGCDLRYVEVNPAFERHTGLKRADILGRTVLEMFPEAESLWFERFGKVASTGIADHFQAKFGPLDRWFEVSAYRTGPNHVATVFFDITERKRAEEELRRSEIRERHRADELETVMAAVPAVVWIAHDPACLRITGNQASYDLLRLPNKANQSVTAREFAEKPVHFKVMKDGVELLPNELPVQLAATGVEVRDFEEEIVFDDGTRIHLFGHAMPLRNDAGEVRGSVAAFVDISDRKKAEEAVRQSEVLFRSMADNAPAMLWVTDPTGYCSYLSAMWYQFTGRTPGKDVGYGWLEAIHPDDLAETERIFLQANRDHRPFTIDYRVRRHDGEYRWAVDSGSPRFDGGKFQGFVGCVFDVHERKLAEDANTRLVEDLRHADQRKDEFLATLAHELRNPLAPIRNGLQIMRLANDEPNAMAQARSMMERQLGQMVHLVDDLLDLSRISRGKIELRRRRIELAKAVQQAIETSRPTIEQAGHELLVEVPSHPIYVDADVTRLAQVFSNLLNNAAKYTERGGQIRLAVQHLETEAVVSIQDNGIGIPAHMLPHVFDMFTQVDRNLERSQGGLGIGLSIVKQLVQMHGGLVEARSDGHHLGSEFIVRLPVVLSVMQPNPGDGEKAIQSSGRRRVLVVDDNRDAALSLAMMLKLMGNETSTAHDGLEALDVASEYRPDLILLDIGMPRMNGYEAARQIRERPWGKSIFLVALTGWGQEEDRRKSELAGFDTHMVKPIEPAALEKLLANLKADAS